MEIQDEKSPAEIEGGHKLDHEESMMYTGRVDAKEYGTLKREYVTEP
jgi:hypothetical protein